MSNSSFFPSGTATPTNQRVAPSTPTGTLDDVHLQSANLNGTLLNLVLNDGATVDVDLASLEAVNTFISGLTFSGSNRQLTLNRNDGENFSTTITSAGDGLESLELNPTTFVLTATLADGTTETVDLSSLVQPAGFDIYAVDGPDGNGIDITGRDTANPLTTQSYVDNHQGVRANNSYVLPNAAEVILRPGDYVTQGGTTYEYTGVIENSTELVNKTITAGSTIPDGSPEGEANDFNTEMYLETGQHSDLSTVAKIAGTPVQNQVAVWSGATPASAILGMDVADLLRNNDVEIYSNLPINTIDLQADTDYDVYIVTRSLTSTATGNNDIAQPSRWYLNDQHPAFVGRPVGETGIMPNTVNSFTLQFNSAAVNNIQNQTLVQAQVALDDDNPRADVFANTWAIPPGAGGSSVPFNLPTNNVTNASVTGNGSILTLTRQNADPVVFAPSGPGPTPERLSITPTSQSYIQNDGSQSFTVTIREQGTDPSITAVTPSSARAGVTFGNPSGLNTGTVTVQVFLSAALTAIAGTFDVHFAVTGIGSGVSYTNHGLNVPVTVQSEWFAGVRTTTPTATSDLASQGALSVGDSVQLVGVENGDIYILAPTSNVATIQFTTANPNIGYDFTNTGVTIGSFTLLTLGETRANSTYTIRIGRV